MVAIDSDIQGYSEAERILREGIDCVTSGFPCQDISVAGKKAGIQYNKSTGEATTRSGLFGQTLRTISMVRPARWIMENVAAIYDGYLGIVLGEVAESGYDAQWDCLSSARIGRGHLRERFYCVAYPDSKRLQRGIGGLQEDKEQGNIHVALFPTFPLRPPYQENDLPKPLVVGAIDGIPDRSHRIKSLGNTVDPELVEIIGKQL